ncbi:predicted protein [Lichtheimia corymbifera JMRC:FSU:9682]|uniref:Uncharacterized protein n=1 Tax=Lichtheimia corymbifera JMRC:FSU:9682 TaxID=1263082 RepID=A0A068RFL3_9FUNG|nr:predicted protein [Lichtheimia corymbifera JMRC:FSU:9682]
MYSDQTLLPPPPPLPSSPSRFNLPPIVSSAAFSTATLPRLAYTTGPNPHDGPHDDKADRWQLPPLPSLTPFHNSPGVPSSPGNHNIPPTRLPEQQQQQQQHQPRQRLQPPPPASSPPPPPPPQLPAQSSSIWRINPVTDYEIHHHHSGATIPVSSSDLPPTTASPKHYQAAVPEGPQYYASSFGRKQATLDYTNKADLVAEYNERTLEIDREFQENKETIYLEKLKKLQEELSAIQHGGHEVFDDHVADLEKDHSKEIHNGQLMMQYRIQCAEKWYNEALRVVEEESEAEKRELKKAMLAIIEEKRKRIREYRDEEIMLNGDAPVNVPQTRNRRRTRGAAAAAVANGLSTAELTLEQVLRTKNNNRAPKRRHNDRSRELGNVTHALNAKNEAELEADFDAMHQDTVSSDEYMVDGTSDSAPHKRAKANQYHHGSTFHGRSSRR